MDWDYLIWLWREIPRDWKVSAVACAVLTLYLLLEIWSTFA
jgi:hypothetical protein